MTQDQQPTPHFTVHAPHFSQAPLAGDLETLDRVARAHVSEALDDFVDLLIADAVFPVAPGDQVVVVEDALTAVRVRVVAGAARGRSGWIPATWLRASGSVAGLAA